jgi:hypothetical protein
MQRRDTAVNQSLSDVRTGIIGGRAATVTQPADSKARRARACSGSASRRPPPPVRRRGDARSRSAVTALGDW